MFSMGYGVLVKVHGENGTVLIVDVKDGAVKNMREWKNETDAYFLVLRERPTEDHEGPGHDGAVQMSVTTAGLVVALAAAWVLV